MNIHILDFMILVFYSLSFRILNCTSLKVFFRLCCHFHLEQIKILKDVCWLFLSLVFSCFEILIYSGFFFFPFTFVSFFQVLPFLSGSFKLPLTCVLRTPIQPSVKSIYCFKFFGDTVHKLPTEKITKLCICATLGL